MQTPKPNDLHASAAPAKLAVVGAARPGRAPGGLRSPVLRKARIAIVDPSDRHREHIRSYLAQFYDVISFRSSLDVQRSLPRVGVPAAILMDELTLPGGGVAALDAFSLDPSLADVPLIGITSSTRSGFARLLQIKGCPVLSRPVCPQGLHKTLSVVLCRVVEARWDVIEPIQREALKKTVAIFNSIPNLILEGKPIPYKDVRESCMFLVRAVKCGNLGALLENVKGHDNYTYVHSIRVATFLTHFGYEVGLEGEDLLTLATGGLLHDIGKVAIPHEVLNKPGQLTDDEWALMRSHVGRTTEMLDLMPDVPRGVITIARQHHEKLDGTGYPHGLSGPKLNELARMAAVVDVFGALTDRRVYKEAMQPEEALDLMADMTGHLDQGLVRVFRNTLLDVASMLKAV